jgi:hypothetical protein
MYRLGICGAFSFVFYLCCARLITTVKRIAMTSFIIMLAAEHCPGLFTNVAPSKDELLEIHRSKISLHLAKADYSYPTIRLPHTFSKLAGLPIRIYQTVHEGALAFLVVISSTENAAESPKASVFTRRRSGVRIASGPLFWALFLDFVKFFVFI